MRKGAGTGVMALRGAAALKDRAGSSAKIKNAR